MRTVFLGTSEFAASVLRRLAASDHRPSLVVTRPDRPRGRGRRLSSPPIMEVARALGIPTAQPASVNDDAARTELADHRPQAVCVCAFGALIKEPLLSEHPLYNVHPSLLPRWRGAAPIERALEAGDAITGVSIMRPTAEMDAGPVCLAAAEPIRSDDDFATLAERLERLGGDLLVEALDREPPFVEQPTDGVTLAPKITAEDRCLDAGRTAAALALRVRALNPHIGTFVALPGGERLGVRSATPAGRSEPVVPGTVAARDGRLLFGASDAALELTRVIPPGGRAMDASDYLRGRGASLLAAGR